MIFEGISHAHSTYSFDGTLCLADIKRLLQQSGYSFALMSEHVERLSSQRFAAFLEECRAQSDEHFLFVPGLEFHRECISVNGLARPLHMLDVLDRAVERTNLLQEFFRQGSFNILVHPSLAPQHVFEPFLDRIHAVEVWNSKYDGARFPSARTLDIWRTLNASAQYLPVFGIDLHHPAQLAPLYMSVEMERLSTDELLTTLSASRYTLHHRQSQFEPGSLSASARAGIHAHSVFREIAAEPHREIKPILPPPPTRRLNARVNERPDG